MKIFSGSSNKPLAQGICHDLNIPLGNLYLHNFPTGDRYCQYQENIRGEDVFLIQSGSNPSNDNLMELLLMADAARRASAGRITAVLPMFFYQRQDRKEQPRVPISAKLIMDLLETAGVNRILTMDLHSPQIVGFTNLPVDQLSFETVLTEFIKNKYHSLALRDKVVVVAPDVGGVKRGEHLSEKLGSEFAFISKKRINDTTVQLNSFVGDVKGKIALIVDDIAESCGTLVQAAQICKNNGAEQVICTVTHFCATETGMLRLIQYMPHPNCPNSKDNYIDSLIHSNTVTFWGNKKYQPADIEMISVAPLFAKAIQNIHENKSVSELF